MPKLDNWSVCYAPISPFHAPEMYKQRLCGIVSGSERFSDGKHVTTSVLISFNLDNETVVTKSGSEYELGIIDPEYEKLFPMRVSA